MIKLYHSVNIDSVNWRIYVDNIDKIVSYFPSNTPAIEVVNQLCQISLFDEDKEGKIFVVNIDNWKLTDPTVKRCIYDLHEIPTVVNLAIESATVKNKIFSELNIEVIKATSVTRKAKTLIIHRLLSNAKIQLDHNVEEKLVNLLPDKIDFIKNELMKLQLMGQSTFTEQEIETIIFDLGDATVFNIVDSWLRDNEEETITRLNDLISKNITIQAFVPIFALKLIQIKFFLMAKQSKWSSEIITSKQQIPFWQQRIYSDLRPYDQKLKTINSMLDKLYEFDINVKKQKNIPYTQLIKILFK